METVISIADASDAETIARLAIALFEEIIERTQAPHFQINPEETAARCREYIARGIYTAVIARNGSGGEIVGFATLCESHALYTLGTFGIVQECYVTPEVRSSGVGDKIVQAAADFARHKGWRRLELCTPPLPEFDRTVAFYSENGFEVTGGRKMKHPLV